METRSGTVAEKTSTSGENASVAKAEDVATSYQAGIEDLKVGTTTHEGDTFSPIDSKTDTQVSGAPTDDHEDNETIPDPSPADRATLHLPPQASTAQHAVTSPRLTQVDDGAPGIDQIPAPSQKDVSVRAAGLPHTTHPNPNPNPNPDHDPLPPPQPPPCAQPTTTGRVLHGTREDRATLGSTYLQPPAPLPPPQPPPCAIRYPMRAHHHSSRLYLPTSPTLRLPPTTLRFGRQT
jgi:hypothetical protein